MVCQTQMNGRHESPIRGAARNVADVWHNALSLAELQGRLFLVELAGAARRSSVAAGLLAIGAVLGLAALPIILVCFSCLLIDAGLSAAAAFGIIGGTTLVIAIVLALVGYSQVARSFRDFPRSRVELKRNYQWLKETVRQDS